jgi:hypothetical protein
MAAFTTIMAVISIVSTIASTAYQLQQQKKAKKKAEQAKDARKGFELVVEGDIIHFPLVYGRALIGGVRVWHATTSFYQFPAADHNSDVFWDIAPQYVEYMAGLSQVNYYRYDTSGNRIQVQKMIPNAPGGALNGTQVADKNQILMFQQALCHGPIQGCYDFVIDQNRYLSDPGLAKGGFRTEVHYNGGVANRTTYTNYAERANAKFHGLAYASTFIRINRDDPQFGGSVPTVQYFIEGRKVRPVIRSGSPGSYTYALGTRVYSNNPAWCLLDYLIKSDDLTGPSGVPLFDPGKGLDVSLIDLQSFYDAAQICARIVKTNVTTSGKVWRSTDGVRDIQTRDLPLYECNIVIDTEKQIRENIEILLGTMGDARLVWSAGQYKLNLKYPST